MSEEAERDVEYEPKLQMSHSASSTDPTAVRYFPDEQETHEVRPVSEPNFPAAHGVQFEAPNIVEYRPLEHASQNVESEIPSPD